LLPRRFVREQHVILAIELNEAAIGNEARKQSTLFYRRNHVAFRMHYQGGTPDLGRDVSYVGAAGDLKQSDSSLCRGRRAHLIAPGTRMLRRAARLEERGPYLHKGVVLLAPAKPCQVAQNASSLRLGWRICPTHPASRIGAVEDKMAHPLGMAHRIFDGDGAAGTSHDGEPPKAGRIDHAFEITYPGLKREITDVPVRQPAAAGVMAQHLVLLSEDVEPRPPCKAAPLMLKMSEPGRGQDQWRSISAHRVGKPHTICRRAETDALVHGGGLG
jgi:hypothetical protein